MKKNFMMALVCSVMAINAVNAQTENVYYGSKKGGFAIGVGATPVLDFVGNMFNGSTSNSFYGLGSTLYGKYFVTNNWVVLGGLYINNQRTKIFSYEDANDVEKVTMTNLEKDNDWKVFVGGNYLLRPGKGLQPSIGAMIKYIRGNSTVADTDEENEITSSTSFPVVNALGFAASVGVEYYMSRNISIEANLTLQTAMQTIRSASRNETQDDSYIVGQNYSRIVAKANAWATYSEVLFNVYF